MENKLFIQKSHINNHQSSINANYEIAHNKNRLTIDE